MDKATEESTIRGHPQYVGWILLILLLVLRIPYTIAIIHFLPIENQNGAAFYEIATYFLTATLIWWERHSLKEFHIDRLSLFFIIFVRPIQTLILGYWQVDSPLAPPGLFGVILWAVSIGLLVMLWQSQSAQAPLSSASWAWLLVGLLAGICLSIVQNFQTVRGMLSNVQNAQQAWTPLLYSTGLNVIYHLGFAPINEEPLFRGFLWGYLRHAHWKEMWIWLFQAALFTSSHIYLAQQFPQMFWLFIPGAGLVFGLLAWRSRSLAPAILAHGLVNGSIYLPIVLLVLRALYA
jgi:membrane protease YdiL (CAAX protease family)